MTNLSLFDHSDAGTAQKLNLVHALFERSEPFSFDVFDGFTSLRVLTYSASIPMTVRMLDRFESVECVFGYEGVIQNFETILACQQALSEDILIAVKGLEDDRKRRIVEQVAAGCARFFVVKDAVSHAKIYLLETASRRRVIVGSANFSDRAFSGKQAETLIVFDDEPAAWEHYLREYEAVLRTATTEFHLKDLERTSVALEESPLVISAEASKTAVTLLVNTDPEIMRIPTVIQRVERIAKRYTNIAQTTVKTERGKIHLTREVVGKLLRLVKSQKEEIAPDEEPTWLSIQTDSRSMLLSGQALSLEADPEKARSDAESLVEYFENFKNGFTGDVERHQQDYFLFMSWFYAAPFICEVRNRAAAEHDLIFDTPMFAILHGKSNCGKTKLIETLMQSMFGHRYFQQKEDFTRSALRSLLAVRKRFPVVFDDIDRKRFTDHASEIIKDENFILPEYPAFVLSMNADDHSFATEVRKRCLIIYTQASLPDGSDQMRRLHRSVGRIQSGLTTNLYRTYLGRMLDRFADKAPPTDLLQVSSDILVRLFSELTDCAGFAWLRPVSSVLYQNRKHEKIKLDLIKLYEANRDIWEIRPGEVILRVPPNEQFALRRDIPDWLLKQGSRAGTIILDRRQLETFLEIRFSHSWWRLLRR